MHFFKLIKVLIVIIVVILLLNGSLICLVLDQWCAVISIVWVISYLFVRVIIIILILVIILFVWCISRVILCTIVLLPLA